MSILFVQECADRETNVTYLHLPIRCKNFDCFCEFLTMEDWEDENHQ